MARPIRRLPRGILQRQPRASLNVAHMLDQRWCSLIYAQKFGSGAFRRKVLDMSWTMSVFLFPDQLNVSTVSETGNVGTVYKEDWCPGDDRCAMARFLTFCF